MKLFNSKSQDPGSLLQDASNNYAKAIGFAQKGNPHKATKILNSSISQVKQSGYVETQNARVNTTSGMGGACDFTSRIEPQVGLARSPLATLYTSEILYYTDWQAQKIIDIPVNDMLKKSYYFKGLTEEQDKDLAVYQEELGIYKVLRQALKMERLYGGAVIFMGIRSEIDDPSIPLDPDTIKPDDLLFLNALSRTDISGVTLQTDPTLPFYGSPQMYTIYGHNVHISRLLIFDGEPLRNLKRSYFGFQFYHYNDHFGYPILGRILDDLENATGSRQAAMQLIERASVMLFTGDIQSASAFKDANQNIDALKTLMNNMSNYRAALINSVPGSEASLSTVPANFGAVPELLMMYLQVLSASSDIPATRFLGQAPGGLNATGDSDLNNYYDMIVAKQEHHVKPVIRKLLKVLVPSAGIIASPQDIEIIFPPLKTLNERELAEVRQIDTQNIVSMQAANIISDEEALEELVRKGVLETNPEDFPDPEPVVFDDNDLETPKLDDAIDKNKGDEGDDSRITK